MSSYLDLKKKQSFKSLIIAYLNVMCNKKKQLHAITLTRQSKFVNIYYFALQNVSI